MKNISYIQKTPTAARITSKTSATQNKNKRNRTTAINEIKRLNNEIASGARTTLDKASRVGELLTQLKADLGHGNWLPFVESDLPFSERTAQHYMGIFEKRAHLNSATVADMVLSEIYRQSFDETAPPGELDASNAASKTPELNQAQVKSPKARNLSEVPNFTGADVVARVKASREFFQSLRVIGPISFAEDVRQQLAEEIARLIETCTELAALLDAKATTLGTGDRDRNQESAKGKESAK